MPRKKATSKKIKSDLQATIYDPSGKEKEKVVLPKKIFSVKVSQKAIAQYARVYLVNQRQGTVSTKTRAEVSGSTRKIYRQKGTGRARHGDIKAPIFVGGGVAHGPKPRDFSLKINKKQKQKILFGVLTEKYQQGNIYFIEGLLKIKPKTKEFIKILNNFKLSQDKILLIIYPTKKSNNLILASRNLENIELCSINSINSYQLLKSFQIIFAKEALDEFLKKYGNQSGIN